MRRKKKTKNLTITFENLARWCFYLFFALLPFRIDAVVFTKPIYSGGFFNPYLSHFIYLSDIFLIFGLVFFAVAWASGGRYIISGYKRLSLLVLCFLLSASGSLFFAYDLNNSVLHILRMFMFVLLYFVIASGLVNLRMLLYVLIAVITFSAFVGIFQYILKQSVGIHFLGEPVISYEMKGVAKINFFDLTLLRAYGMFSHPNLFSAYLVFGIFSLLTLLGSAKKEQKILFTLLLSVLLLALLLTFSRGGFLALLAGLLLYYAISGVRFSFKYPLLVIALVVFFVVAFDLSSPLLGRIFIGDQVGFEERSRLFSISKAMLLDHPWGIGLGNFTSLMQGYSEVKLMPWNFQPVHNLYLLVLNEMGFLGLFFFLAMMTYLFLVLLKFRNKSDFAFLLMSFWIAILTIALFDHYFLSIYHGQALFWIYVGMVGAISYNRL